jgi:hypothetical protein
LVGLSDGNLHLSIPSFFLIEPADHPEEVLTLTPSMITLLVIAGIVLLIAIGYINHVVENNKLEKARLKVEFNDRIRRCSEVNETFPGQMMSPGLKLLLTRLELNATQRLLLLNKSSVPLKARVAELEALVAKGDSIPVNNPPRPILTEAKAKDARFLLETLHGQVTRAAKDRVLASNEAKQWLKEIRHLLVILHIEFFNNLGQLALQQNQPGQARLAFERGAQYLRKQPDALYSSQLKAFEAQLARANAILQNNLEPSTQEVNELTEGLRTDEIEGDWKKKAIYD